MSAPEFRSEFHLIRKESDVIKLRVSRGEVVVIFTKGSRVKRVDIGEGVFEIDLTLLRDGKLPVGFQVVPNHIAKLIRKLPVKKTDAILDVALLALAPNGAQQ